MPWRLVVLIVILGILLGFIGLNLGNTCDLSLGFKVFKGVPVYLTVFSSFILGMVSSLPFIIFKSLKKKQKKESQTKTPEYSGSPESQPPQKSDKAPKSKGFFRKKTTN